jgi:thiol:disulfide interchange protein DsbD
MLPRLSCLLLLLLPVLVSAAPGLPGSTGAGNDFLSVDRAFRMGVDLEADPPRVFWQNAPGYYLYRHRLAFELEAAGEARLEGVTIPPGEERTDEYFGDVEVYYDDLVVPLELPSGLPEGALLKVEYQGCADAGLCYPPETRWVALSGPEAGSIHARPPAPVAAQAAAGPAATAAGPVTEEGRLAALLGGDDLTMALALFLLAGIGLAFTPCVLPMVPILSSIIAGEPDVTRRRAALLSAVYVLAMALTYALLGTLVGFFGGALNLHGWLQSPPVLVVFALLFVLLSLSMFGYYELQLPASLRERLERRSGSGGRLTGVAVMGVFSSLLVSPCVSAPLAGALVYISSTGDAVLGGGALFALALGMGVPLMVVGVGGGALLPRAGAWMNAVKAGFGVLLLGVAVWLLERVLPGPVTLVLWAALAIGSGVALGALDFAPRSGIARVRKAAGAMLLVWGVLLLVGAASGAVDPLRPLGTLAAAGDDASGEGMPRFTAVDDLAEVRSGIRQATAAEQPVLLDLYADWCISCKIMERNVFPQPAVRELMGRFELLRADVTANAPRHRELLAHYDLFGPPSLLFFTPEGDELRPFRLQGEIGADDFAQHLRGVLAAAD